jgi:hypothetical protein
LNLRDFFRTANNVSADPQYAKPHEGDYKLIPTSPAVGKGARREQTPEKDLAGIPRPNPPSLGAYEPKSSSDQPSTKPAAFTITESRQNKVKKLK